MSRKVVWGVLGAAKIAHQGHPRDAAEEAR